MTTRSEHLDNFADFLSDHDGQLVGVRYEIAGREVTIEGRLLRTSDPDIYVIGSHVIDHGDVHWPSEPRGLGFSFPLQWALLGPAEEPRPAQFPLHVID